MWHKWKWSTISGKKSLKGMAHLFFFFFSTGKGQNGWISNRILIHELVWGMEVMHSRLSRKKPDSLYCGIHTSLGLTPSRLYDNNKLLSYLSCYFGVSSSSLTHLQRAVLLSFPLATNTGTTKKYWLNITIYNPPKLDKKLVVIKRKDRYIYIKI